MRNSSSTISSSAWTCRRRWTPALPARERAARHRRAGDRATASITQLKAMGHEVTIAQSASFGGSQAIIKLPKGYVAGSDPRKDGHAAGY